jgi:signal transduction histidine kinase
MIVPMIARERTLGAITLVSAESGRRYTHDDLTIATDLAVRAALAVDNARLYRDAQERAATQAELNAALRAAMDQLERELQTRDEFLASASHDLKNPIATIKGNAQLLLRRLDRSGELKVEQVHDALQRIVSVATRAAIDVDDLLDTARMQMGRPLELDKRPTDLVQLTTNLLAEQQQQTEQHTFRLDSDQPTLVVLADDRRLARALGNLLENAVKYSPEGGLIRVEVARDDRASEAVVSVHDQGIGIPQDDVARIFDRFERGSNAAGVSGGSGIGLASVKYVVECHDGSIHARSEVGRGSTFTIRLPIGGASQQNS